MEINLEQLSKVRLKKIKNIMKKRELDALVVTSLDSVRYVKDIKYPPIPEYFYEGYASIIYQDAEPDLLVPSAEESPMGYVASPPPTYTQIPIVANKWADLITGYLRKQNITSGRIGFDYFPIQLHQAVMSRLPNIKLIPTLDDIMKTRAIKASGEIKLLRKTAEILDNGIMAAQRNAEPGLNEYQLMASIQAAIMESGPESLNWLNFRSGERTLSSWFANGRTMKDGDAYVFDVGCMSDGYWGDVARTGVVGEPSRELQMLYDDLYDSYLEGLKVIKPGNMASMIDETIRGALRERGLSAQSTPMGHGIGLRVTESPLIAERGISGDLDMMLEAGMVLCVEPRTYRDGIAGVGVEDMILVTETGYEVLNKANNKLLH
jgi:Xaa-Pro aminopeptidase